MTNDDLKAAAREITNEVEAVLDTNPFLPKRKPEDIDLITDIVFRKLQPLVDADREKIERYEEALREIMDETQNGIVWITASTALGEE